MPLRQLCHCPLVKCFSVEQVFQPQILFELLLRYNTGTHPECLAAWKAGFGHGGRGHRGTVRQHAKTSFPS